MFRVVIAGSRVLPQQPEVMEEIKRIIVDIINDYGESNEDVAIISGGANGADKFGEMTAMEQGYLVEVFTPNWEPIEGYPVRYNKQGKPYNPVASHIRNGLMADHGDILIAIWDGKSKGTKNMIDTMRSLGKTTFVINF